MGKTGRKLILFTLILSGLVLFFSFDVQGYLTLDQIRESHEYLTRTYVQHPILFIGTFVGIYIPIVTLSLPGATILALAAGAVMGVLTGTVVVSFSSSIGATFACLISRYLLQDWVQDRFGERLATVDAGIHREGAFYLFSMRLIPVIPFFVINLVMGLTAMPLRTFYWVSQVGMLAGTFLFVNAGSQLARIESVGDILSPQLIISFSLLGLFPLVIRKLLNLFRTMRGSA